MIAVTYKNHKFYINQQTEQVYDLKKNLLGSKFIQEIGFNTMKQMWNYLRLHMKKPRPQFLDQKTFCQILSQNLHLQGKLFKPSYYSDRLLNLRGLNYKIVKLKDSSSVLDMLLVVKMKLNMEFVQEKIDYGTLNPSKTSLKSINKYINSPYGSNTKHYCYTMPFLLQRVLCAL